ncbi:MAG: TrkH family potassium uptake protein, partial [Phycicoccus sp.]
MRLRQVPPTGGAVAGARRRVRAHPARAVFIGFAAAIAVGTGLLALPISRAGTGGATLLEAAFTAVSAVCVTGLTVTDTATYWTGFGQVVILLLIQVGGFGVATFASLVGLIVVRRLSLTSRLATATEAKNTGIHDVAGLIRRVLLLSLVIEGIAALILTVRFAVGDGRSLGESAWLGVFHSVSAFNNAGFALFSDNMISYATDPTVSITLALATILGGLGFPVLIQLRRHLRHPLAWTMNTRLVLWATGILLVLGTLYITVIEWNNPATLGTLDPAERVLVGFFHSVQTRTAGFNSVDIGEMQPATLFGMDALMLIGGGPAGTAGGIKVTTFGVLFFILLAEVRGDGVVNVFGKRLSRAVHRQAISVVLLAVGAVVVGTVAIMLISGRPLGPVLFESVSAFATVGLSTGITADLPPAAQLVLMLLMFIGRLGPVTFATALALRS